MILTRDVPGHWWADTTDLVWLTDAAIDATNLAVGTIPVTFTADLVVPAGATAVVGFRTGGLAETVGSATAASKTQSGPFDGNVQGVDIAGVQWSGGMILVHLAASTSDASKPVEIKNVRI